VNSAFIVEYKTAHQEMLEALRVMDEMALGPVPYQLRFSHTRLRVTRAANDSRAALHKILAVLLQLPGPTTAGKVEVLKQLHVELREVARRHMATWTHAAAQSDWAAYCQSHGELAQRWYEIIDRERRLLYPVL
jgi:hypothetical protein